MRQKKEGERGLTKEKVEKRTEELKQGMEEKFKKIEKGVIPTIEQFYERRQEKRPLLAGADPTLEDSFHESHFREDSGKHARGSWDATFKGTNMEDELI